MTKDSEYFIRCLIHCNPSLAYIREFFEKNKMFNENPVPPKCLTVHFENKAEEMGVISTEKERGSPGVHAWTAAPPDDTSNNRRTGRVQKNHDILRKKHKI